MKICVHITFFVKYEKKIDFNKLNKVIKNYLSLSKKTHIFIHTNINIKKKLKFVNFITHNLKNEDPHKLSWKCRALMEKQKDQFDYYIYSEDDILFNKRNFKAWLNYKDLCIDNKFNLGFLRTEKSKKKKILWSIDQPKNLDESIIIDKNVFVVLKNPYCAMWIYDKKEFNNFIKSEFWHLDDWSGDNPYTELKTREKSAIGWHGLNMKRYKASIIPIKNFKIVEGFYIQHLDNKYIEHGPFSIKVQKLIKKDLKNYKDSSFIDLIFLNFRFFYKKYLRVNLKNYKK